MLALLRPAPTHPTLLALLYSQLMRMGSIEDTFSLCFGYPHGGVLLLGGCAHGIPAGLLSQTLHSNEGLFLHFLHCTAELELVAPGVATFVAVKRKL